MRNTGYFNFKEHSMRKHTISLFSFILPGLLIGVLLVSCGSSAISPNPSSGGTLDGQTLMQQRCSLCHSLDRVTAAHKTVDQWTVSVNRMVARGAPLNTLEQQTLIAYMAANYK
jgi:mono/diheme cytochrome c family protein